jgi:TetR/AcrR family transcriptional repressor of nem operon
LRYPAGHKAQTFRRIVETACRCFRRQGINEVSVAELMASAGLSHGGFYAHFASKDALVAAAVGHGLDVKRHLVEDWVASAERGENPIAVVVRNYLSTQHRDNIGDGCPLPALSAEIARGNPVARTVLTEKLMALVAVLAEAGPFDDSAQREASAIAVLSTLVGAILLARATNDSRYSDEILRASREMLLKSLRSTAVSKRRRAKKQPQLSG